MGYVSAAPEVNENRKPTERQLEVQETFKKSAASAQRAMKNPEVKAAYKAAAFRETFEVGIRAQVYVCPVGGRFCEVSKDHDAVQERRHSNKMDINDIAGIRTCMIPFEMNYVARSKRLN